ncbi:hypothetical protein [Metabacillus sp. RGM 3146]|uniref:hypothetical protein n=1 Tax=Metabacillus sp. RGM 3146 TaxID=3401092 RepID=UPI003B9A7DD2
MAMAALGLLLDQKEAVRRWTEKENVFSFYLIEMLNQKGIPYEIVSSADENLEKYDLILCGVLEDTERSAGMLLSYINGGGRLINFSDSGRLAAHFNCSVEKEGTGYASMPEVFRQQVPLRFLRASIWQDGIVKGEAEAGSLMLRSPDSQFHANAVRSFSSGSGRLIHWNVDIPYTIVALQQGTKPVTEDGIPAPDGSAAIDDDLLKADDSFELDWEIDRIPTETGMLYFAHPYADYWKEVFLKQLLNEAIKTGKSLPFVAQWPDGINQVATISHDSDGNLDAAATKTADVLRELSVQTTWCMIEPGYSGKVYEEIIKDGHELAFHYNALEKEQGIWGEHEFIRQLESLKKSSGLNDVTTNKNHYTLFEGWGELFKWCEKTGIELDQSRGPSKKGNIGFLFGTCLPYFPIDWHTGHNQLFGVLELGFLTQDLNHHALADTSVIRPFLKAVKTVGGAAHFLFHQNHICEQPLVEKALREVIWESRAEGFTFWTSKEINRWERKRRKLKIIGVSKSGKPIAENTSEADGAVIYTLIPNGQRIPHQQAVEVYGLLCNKTIISHPKARVHLGRS